MADAKNLYTVAFYNLENLFDTVDDPQILDEDFTEISEKEWTQKRFKKKVKKLGNVISEIGTSETGFPPAIIGVAEVENEFVLKELCDSKALKNKGYTYIHYDSPDERGIDTALLYRSSVFTVLHSEVFTLYVENEPGIRDFTRDILYVKGILKGQELHLLVNHWPSRRDGAALTEYKRIAAAEENRKIVQKIVAEQANARILIVGDFNDDPKSNSIQTLIKDTFYNPMEILHTMFAGSLSHKGAWNLFDQIILSNNFLQQHGNPFRFEKAKIFNPKNLQEYSEKYKGLPFRTYVGKKYLGGFSDHFPVYGLFSIETT